MNCVCNFFWANEIPYAERLISAAYPTWTVILSYWTGASEYRIPAYRYTVNRYRFTDTHNKSNNNIIIIQLPDTVVTSTIASTKNGSHCRATLEFTSAPQSFTNLSTNLRQNKWCSDAGWTSDARSCVVQQNHVMIQKIHDHHIYHNSIYSGPHTIILS